LSRLFSSSKYDIISLGRQCMISCIYCVRSKSLMIIMYSIIVGAAAAVARA